MFFFFRRGSEDCRRCGQRLFVDCSVKTRFQEYGQRSGSESATKSCVDGRLRAQGGVARVAARAGC
jgi:hypothetical protein